MTSIETIKVKAHDFVANSSEASPTSQEVSKTLMRSLISDASGADSEIVSTPSNNDDGEDELFGLHESSPLIDRVKVLCLQSFPVVVSFFLSIGGTFVNLIFAGQYVHETGNKSAVFAGVSLANMFANVSCLSILIGMSSAVETLGSQHNGAGNYREVGFVLQRSYLILGIITIPIAVLWFFTANIFAALGVEPVVCAVIQRFIRIRCLTIPVDVINESYEKYLMSIGVMRPSMWANISFNVCILLFDTIFVYGLRLHYDCLAWSWVLSLYLSAIIQIALSWNHPSVQRTLQPFSKAAFEDWYEFIMLGLPGTVMLCSEWWAYEVLTIFASLLGTAEVAAQTIILQTASLAFMIPLGIGVACASLVGNALGAGKKSLAIDLGKLSISGIFCLELLIGIMMLIGGPYFVDMFTNDPEVILVANRAVPFLSMFTMIDGLQGVCSGVLRGAGKQGIGAVANIFAFYVIGLPMAWVLCFKAGFGVNGLMMGIAFGTVFQVIVLLTIIFGFENYLYSTAIHAATPDKHTTAVGTLSKPQHRDFQRLQDHDDEESRHGIALNPIVRNLDMNNVDQ
jgi:MATE family multidrug resistance protein